MYEQTRLKPATGISVNARIIKFWLHVAYILAKDIGVNHFTVREINTYEMVVLKSGGWPGPAISEFEVIRQLLKLVPLTIISGIENL